MGTSTDRDEFKRDAVQQIGVRGYPVRAVSQRLGESSPSLSRWLGLLAAPAPKVSGIDHEAENRRLKRELARVTEERDILKKGEPWITIGSSPMARAVAESVFQLLKRDRIRRRTHLTRKAARQDAFDYIEML